MTLPAQLPLLNTKPVNATQETSKAKAPEPVAPPKDKDHNEFEKAMQSADQTQDRSTGNRDTESEGNSETGNPATEDGSELPVADSAEGTAAPIAIADSVLFVDETLKLQLGLNQFTAEQADDAVLLATQFVVDSLPGTIKETATEVSLASNVGASKPELLVRLQAQINQTTGQSPILLNPDSVNLGAIRELVQGKEQSTQGISSVTSVDSVAPQTQAAQELRATLQTAKPELVVPNRVGSEGWSEAMAGRISLLVNQRISAARIHINPPELGPIEVRVNVNNDQASVQFTSQSAQVRDALEQSIPRLRDMLETAGFSLADSGVNDQGGQNQGGERGEEGLEAGDEQLTQSPRRESMGLVDDYV